MATTELLLLIAVLFILALLFGILWHVLGASEALRNSLASIARSFLIWCDHKDGYRPIEMTYIKEDTLEYCKESFDKYTCKSTKKARI